ncbi:hypothetical protein [Facklamia hominis]|uniref:hypothetical protein n=1 Tax=Facklamia hominis TaxID=178214 RepID=UPI0038FC3616
MKSLSPIKQDSDLVTVKYLHDNIDKMVGGGLYCDNLVEKDKLATFANYSDLEINEFGELIFTFKQDKDLTLRIIDDPLSNKGKFLIQGLIERNGKPLLKSEWKYLNASKIQPNSESFIKDGFFRVVSEFTETIWILHAPIKTEVGDEIKIKHLQIYKL